MTGLPRSTLYDAITRNELRVIRVGKGTRKVILIPAEELDRFLQVQKK